MPTRKLYIQASFEQGMIDTVSFDYDYEDSDLKFQLPQNRGALLIENFDPSIVRGALTKRYGYGYVRSLDWNTDAGLVRNVGRPVGFDQTNVITTDIDRYTLLIDTDPVGANSIDKVTFLGATAVPYNKPVGQNVIVFFLRDINNPGGTNEERTLVLNYSANYQNENPRWRNPHIDGLNSTGTIRGTPPQLQPSAFPGWDISGTYTDHARHGGNLVITTDVAIELPPNNTRTFNYSQTWVKDKMYPCYVWTYWDLRRKRDDGRKFWNVEGTNPFPDLIAPYTMASDKYSQFKVMYPSMYPTRNTLVSFKAYQTDGVITANPFDSSGGSFYSDPALAPILSDAPVAPVEVVLIEFKGRNYSRTPQTYPWTQGFVAPEKHPTQAVWPYLKEYATHIQSIEVLNNMPIQNDGSARWNVMYRANKGVGVIDIINVEIMRGEQYRDGRVIAVETKEKKVQNGEIHADEQSVTGKSFYYVIGVQLPNYLESNNPRPWIKDEKIPWVCTFKLRGSEVIAGKGVHVVNRPIAPAYPSMWWMQDSWTNDLNTEFNLGHQDTSSKNDQFVQYPTDGAIKQQFSLYKTQTTKLNGNNYLLAANRGYSYRVSGMAGFNNASFFARTTVGGLLNTTFSRDWYPYPSLTPYCYEPFNPTTSPSFVADVPTYQFNNNYNQFYTDDKMWMFHWHTDIANNYLPIGTVAAPTGPPGFYDANKPGYRKDHTEPNLIYFAIKIKKTEIGKFVDMGLEAINLYVAEPGEDSQFRSVGLQNISDPLPGIYMLPSTTEFEDYTKYRLVKSYVVDGDGEPLYDSHGTTAINKWKDNYSGTPIATNAWLELANSYLSVGQNEDKSVPLAINCALTPDFVLWDYPATSTTLQLNSSGKYWQGIGARCVTNIKGRTFLAGCIDKYGEEEQAIIRYSDIQSGVISLDIFSEENYLKVGGMPHTALLEYREQLWTFSRHECHRIQMPTIGDVSTWEYLDKIPGQGTFSTKTTITTPDGVFWCNESGVWLSDGRMPSNLAEPVLTYYKAMATDNPPYYATQIGLPRFPYNDEGFNPYMELSYDEARNELVVSSPIAQMVTQPETGTQPIAQNMMQEYRLIFSFSSKTWRVEYIDLPAFGQPLNIFDTTGTLAF